MSWGNEQSRSPKPPSAFPVPNVPGGYMPVPTYTHTPSQRSQALPHAQIGDPRLEPPPHLPRPQFPVQPAYPSEYASAVPRAFDSSPIPHQPVREHVNKDSRYRAMPQVHVQAPSLPHAQSHAHAKSLAHPPTQAHVPSHAHASGHGRAPSHSHEPSFAYPPTQAHVSSHGLGHARAPSHAYASSHIQAPSHAHVPNHDVHAPSHTHAPSHIRAQSHARVPDSSPPPYVDNRFSGPERSHLSPPVQSSGGWSFGGAPSRATYEYGPSNGFEQQPSLPVPHPLARPSSTSAQSQPDVGRYQAHTPVSHSPRVGQKKALLVGINYSKRDHILRLNGCVDDAQEMARFLQEHLGFHPNNTRILTDDQGMFDSRKNSPTKKHILSGMSWLVEGAQPGDSLFFYFSGHGTQVKDEDGDELDGFDECMCAVDYDGGTDPPTGHIVDDEIHRIMVMPLPRGCRLTAVFDCCNSGTLLDLPYVYDSQGVLKKNRPEIVQWKRSEADIISLSACKDGRKAYQTGGGGALRKAFIKYMMTPERQGTYLDVIQTLRTYMVRNGLTQLPQLSSAHWIDTNRQFTITG